MVTGPLGPSQEKPGAQVGGTVARDAPLYRAGDYIWAPGLFLKSQQDAGRNSEDSLAFYMAFFVAAYFLES